jgi:predicted nucleic acid-binding protein
LDELAGEVVAHLRRGGRASNGGNMPKGYWVAPVDVHEHGHSVMTLNFGEFERVPGLNVVRWTT